MLSICYCRAQTAQAVWQQARKEKAMSATTTHQTERPESPVDTPLAAAGSKDVRGKERRGWILATLCLAQLMISLDVLIVNIALPSAQSALGFGIADRQWAVTAYTLAFGSLLLLGGRLSDLFGRKRMFVIGLVGFGVASAAGGAATSFAMLAIARAVQGAFAAVLAPAALALLTTTFTDAKDRARAFGVYAALAGGGAAVGLLLGGLLVQYLNWRWCMFVNVGFAATALLGAAVLLAPDTVPTKPSLDVPGVALVSAGLFGLVFGLSHASTAGWSNATTLGFVVAGAILLIGFTYRQTQASSPVLPLRVVLDRNRGAAYLAIVMVGIGQFGMLLFVTYYCQRTLGFTAVQSGLAFLPWLAAFTTMAQVGTRVIAKRVGPRWTLAPGISVMGIALVMLSHLGVSSSYAAGILPALVLFGAGAGLTVSSAVNAATSVVDQADAGVASAMVNMSQMIGASLGTAVLNSLAVSAIAGYLAAHAGQAHAAAHSATHSYDVAFTVSAAVVLIGSVVVGVLARGELPRLALTSSPRNPLGTMQQTGAQR
jgi:EmrB/QacA subfamily drug resistance transporter